MNISTSQKSKTKTEIYKVLQLLFTMFHILKSLHNIFIINPTSYNSFNVQNQTIIHPPFDWFISNLLRYLNELFFLFLFFLYVQKSQYIVQRIIFKLISVNLKTSQGVCIFIFGGQKNIYVYVYKRACQNLTKGIFGRL